ncbi:endonuclease domain-containing protein [Sphingobium nicotianae]|uniref:endonuclease domain-containing protein n=1 Tax=Sphingobium nicotianae TaxID=2782607 RepID=UPI0032D8BA5E
MLDFYCPSAKLAIEIDGMAHDMGHNPARDGMRDGWLAQQGVETLRIPARQVMADFDAVVRQILQRCAISPPPASPVPLPICNRED